jgi:hypothetical protein
MSAERHVGKGTGVGDCFEGAVDVVPENLFRHGYSLALTKAKNEKPTARSRASTG